RDVIAVLEAVQIADVLRNHYFALTLDFAHERSPIAHANASGCASLNSAGYIMTTVRAPEGFFPLRHIPEFLTHPMSTRAAANRLRVAGVGSFASLSRFSTFRRRSSKGIGS